MRLALTQCGVVMAPATALAAEAGEGGAVSPFSGDVGSAIWTLVIFVAVILVLGKWAWGPILDALQKREEFIRDSLAQAKKDREDAEARLKEYTAQLDAARAEASGIVEEGRRDAEVLKQKIEQNAKDEAQRMIERAKREIELATDTAVKELYTVSANLATDLAGRIIRKQLDAGEHERLIGEAIEELQGAGGNGKRRR